MAWRWRGKNGQRAPFCGDEKKSKFCVGMRAEMCGADMCGSVRQGCIHTPLIIIFLLSLDKTHI